jgi:hypothetical protein
MPDSGDWSIDHSPERQQPQLKSFEIQKPRLSRVQLPTYVYFVAAMRLFAKCTVLLSLYH